MAFGKAFKQTYFGRVIRPAEPKSYNNKNFLEFSVAVDNAVTYKDADGSYKKKTLYVNCSYTPRGQNPALDPVVAILTRISTKDAANNTLAGATYKSVEVIVEGTEDFYENAEGKLRKSLRYCDVCITDNALLTAFRTLKQAQTGQPANGQQPAYAAPVAAPGAPVYAAPVTAPTAPVYAPVAQPVAQPVAAPVAQPVAAPAQYPPGSVIDMGGVPHQLVGNDPSNRDHWVAGSLVAGQFVAASSQASLVANSVVNNAPVAPTAPVAQPVAAPVAPVAAEAPAAPVAPVSAVKSALMGAPAAPVAAAPAGTAGFLQAPPNPGAS